MVSEKPDTGSFSNFDFVFPASCSSRIVIGFLLFQIGKNITNWSQAEAILFNIHYPRQFISKLLKTNLKKIPSKGQSDTRKTSQRKPILQKRIRYH